MENWFDPRAMGSSPDLYSPIAGLGEVIGRIRERRRKREMDERELALRERMGTAQMGLESRKADLYGKQIEAQNLGIKRADRRDDLKFKIEEAKRRGEVGKSMFKALGGGRLGEARAIAGSSQFLGPDDEMQGVQLEQMPNELPRGQQPAEPRAPEWQGPLEPPEEARARAMFEGLGGLRKQQESTEPPPFDPNAPSAEEQGAAAMRAGDEAADFVNQQQGARDQYASAIRSYPSQKIEADRTEAAYQDAEKNPKYKVSYPGGIFETIDPREAKMAAQQEAADHATQLENAATAEKDPNVAASMLRQAQLIRSQISNADKAPITNMGAATQAQGAKASESAKDRQNRLDVAKTRAMAKGLGHRGPPAPGSKEYQKEETQLASELDKYETKQNLTGPKGLGENQRELTNAYKDATAANQNPVKQLQILDRLIKTATGLGVRQQMLETYMNHMGGLLERGEGVAQQWVNGTVGQAQWANVVDALRQSLAESQEAGGKANKGFHETYDKSDAAKRHPDLVRRREMNMFSGLHGYGNKPEQQQAAPAAPAAGGGTTTLQMPDGTMATFDASGKRVK